MNLFSKLSTWYFSRKALPYWSIILLDCLVILFSGLLVYALNNGIFATMGIFWHLSLTWGVCLVPYLVGFRLFRTYSGIIRYSSFVDLQRVGFAVLFGVVCVVTFQEFTDFSPYLVYIRKRDLVLSSLLAMSLMWAMRVFVKYFYVTTFRQSKAERAFIFGVKQGGISLAKSIQNQDPAQYVLAGFVSEAGNMQNRILMGVRVYPFDEELILNETKGKKLVVTYENHGTVNGIGSAVADVLAKNGAGVPLLKLGATEIFGQVGMVDLLKEAYKLTAKDAVAEILKAWHKVN